MKTKLPKRSQVAKDKLDRIVHAILEVAKDKVAMIILFGSYARGDWVQDYYVENHITYSYESDLDLLVVLKKGKYLNHSSLRIQTCIEKRLEFAGLKGIKYKHPTPTLIYETINSVNKSLEKGRYFYSDIKKEGVMLYDSGEFQLAEARILPWEERRDIAREDFDYWFTKGAECMIDVNNIFKRDSLSKTAFELHQATESFYNTILLVFTGYKPKLHDIRKLGGIAGNYSEELLKVFPLSSHEQIECFDLLVKAYIEARYNKNYKITKEQLLYLIERVERLKTVTEKMCLEKINS